MMVSIRQWLILFAACIFIFASCQKIERVFNPENARQKYVKAIKDSPFTSSPFVQQWLAAGDSVLSNPLSLDVPVQSKIIYYTDEANAWAWKFSLAEGRTLRAHLADADTSHQIFLDLFTVENGQRELLATSDDTMLTYTMDQTRDVILRLQPELLVSGSITITLTDNPSMAFPVQGAIRADIGSFWGDPRDGGRRQHEGVDIFAERGTPVLATAQGRVSRTGNGGLGGKSVWLRANGKAMYYAHLDSINTSEGQQVQTGDTLGFVGNSGNARTTPPHLHFGIYNRGAINPLPFIDFANDDVETITTDFTRIQKWARVSAPEANIRPLPGTQQPPLRSLSRHNPVQITGGVGEWYQVKLPDGTEGFIYQSLLEPAQNPLGELSISQGDSVYSAFTAARPLVRADSTLSLSRYGQFQNRQLAKFNNRWVWLEG